MSMLKFNGELVLNIADVASDVYFVRGEPTVAKEGTIKDWLETADPIKLSLKEILQNAGGGLKAEYAEQDGQILDKDRIYLIDTSSASHTYYLPANPEDLDVIFLADRSGNAQSYPTIIKASTNEYGIKPTINGVDDDLACDVNNFYIGLIYDAKNLNWIVVNINK